MSRDKNRLEFPEIAKFCDLVRAKGGTVKVLAAVNKAGVEVGAVDDRLRNLEEIFDAQQAKRIFTSPSTYKGKTK